MKPIQLTLSGLNSYIEEQTIDFKALSSRGLFGIFGPTGCGKSTLLDGITIALYGYDGIARSTKEFVNTACDKAYISYIFEISDGAARKRYQVERSIKRKGDGITTDYVRFQSFGADGEPVEILDKTREVNDRVVELLGLTAADFTRSVVLPQGKFSEFLTLSGKDRRDMLERILNLREFGGALNDRIRQADRRLERMEHMASGEIERYEEITEDLLKAEKQKKTDMEILLETLKNKRSKQEKELRETTAARQLTVELEQVTAEVVKLEEQKPHVQVAEKRLTVSGEAQQYLPQLEQEAATRKHLAELKQAREESRVQQKTLKEKADQLQSKWKAFQEQYAQAAEQLAKQEVAIEQAGENADLRKQLQEKRDQLATQYKTSKQRLTALEKETQEVEEQRKSHQRRLEELEQWEKANGYTQEEQDQIREGAQLEKELKALTSAQQETQRNFDRILKRHEEEVRSLAELRELADWADMEKQDGQRIELEQKIRTLSEQCEKDQEKLDQLTAEQTTIDKALSEWKQVQESQLRERVLVELSDGLEDQSPCPLCGSLDHPNVYEAPESNVLLDHVRGSELQEKMHQLQLDIQRVRMNHDQNRKALEEVKGTYGDMPPVDREKLAALRATYQLKRQLETIEVASLQKEIHSQELLLERTKSALQHEKQTLKAQAEQVAQLQKQMGEMVSSKEQAAGNYEARLLRMNQWSRTAQKHVQEQKNIHRALRELEESHQRRRPEMEQHRLKLSEIQQEGETFRSRMDELDEQNKKLLGALTLEAAQKRWQEEKEKLQHSREQLEAAVEQVKGQLSAVDQQLATLTGQIESTEKQHADQSEQIKAIFEQSSFENGEQLRDALLQKQEAEQLQNLVKRWKERQSIAGSRKAELEKKLDDQRVTQEQLRACQEAFEYVDGQYQETHGALAALQEKLQSMEKHWIEKKEIVKRLTQIRKVRAVLAQIIKLIKGNRFVEFVALRHLRYIAADASGRLMDITNHRYSLELDEKGNFIICDHYNGGVRRDTNTLSGGETFLTALSLSLALSSQIQLKGRASLEFFFLDEGFGTLDQALLDTVMTSLERLWNEEMAVGIISHVDELKNRVPIKLIVEPAEAGIRGTSTRMETT